MAGVLIYFKILTLGTAKVGLGSYTDEKAKIKYRWSFFSFENAEFTYCKGFVPLEVLK